MEKYLLWVASGIVTLMMAMGGVMKLSGQEMGLAAFAELGLPVWFGVFIGVCELLGAVGVWIRRYASLAAAGIGIIMLGAIYYHIQFPPLQAGIPALIVLLCTVYIFIRRLPDAMWKTQLA